MVDNQTVFTLSPANGDYFPEETQAYIYTNNISSITCSNSAGIVETIVNTNPSYKRLYIEDPKIRPLQVGDKIIDGTIFYFNFPDNFNEVLSTASNIGEFIKTEEKNPDYDTLYLKIESSSYEVCFKSNYGVIDDIYYYDNNQLNANYSIFKASIKNILNFGYNYATVNFIDENNIAYPYVLVDITTLG